VRLDVSQKAAETGAQKDGRIRDVGAWMAWSLCEGQLGAVGLLRTGEPKG
jgi:hypothetical protein